MKRLTAVIALATASLLALPAMASPPAYRGDASAHARHGGHSWGKGHGYGHHRPRHGGHHGWHHRPRHHYGHHGWHKRHHWHHGHHGHHGHRCHLRLEHHYYYSDYSDPGAVILGSAVGGLIGHSLGEGDPYATLSGVIVGGAIGYGLGHEHERSYRRHRHGLRSHW